MQRHIHLFHLFTFCMLIGLPLRAQQIVTQVQGNQITYSVQGQPPPVPLVGAPAPRRGYLWIFDDGTYSQDSVAVKQYAQPGNHSVALYTNDKYGNGGPPPPAYANSGINAGGIGNMPIGHTALGYVRITSNRVVQQDLHALVPEEHTVMILTYGNPSSQPKGPGHVVVGFNPDDLPDQAQELDTTHQYFRETIEVKSSYPQGLPRPSSGGFLSGPTLNFDDYIHIQYDSLGAGEERNIFLVMNTILEPDSTTNITRFPMKAWHVLDQNTQLSSQQGTETDLLVAFAEDPNRILVNEKRAPWYSRRPQQLEYTVQFQNEGSGPASVIKIDVTGNGSLDFNNIEVTDWYPHPPKGERNPTATSKLITQVAEDGEGVIFTLDNVYLPGVQQVEGVDEDSTQGFITFTVPTNRNFRRNALAQASIIFDKQAALETNQARTRLIKAWRPRVSAGITFASLLPLDLAEAGSHPGFHVEVAFDRYRPKGAYISPHFSAQQLAAQSTDGLNVLDWIQLSASIINIHAQPLPGVKVGMGLTGHWLIPGTERARVGSLEGFTPGSPFGAGFYSQAAWAPFRRGPEVYLRGQFQYLDYITLSNMRPELYQLQAGLAYTF
ncbi:MAG: hypothetical protein AAFQ98_10740 [Bacteroidota bacterium]